MKTRSMMTCAGVLVLASMSAQAGVLVFTDGFDNGLATQIASESPNYWVNVRDTSGVNSSYVTSETASELTMTASRTGIGGQPAQFLRSANLDDRMNFWTSSRTYQVTGLSVLRDNSSPGGNWDGSFYFNVYSTTSSALSMGTNSGIGIRLRSDGLLTLGFSDHSGVGYGANGTALVNKVSMGSSQANLKGIELTLDGSSGQLVYNLRIQYGGTNGYDANGDGWIDAADVSKNSALAAMSGSLTVAQTTSLLNHWLSENGTGVTAETAKGALELSVRDTSAGVAGSGTITTTVKVGQVNVYAVPEPASLSLIGLGTGLMLCRRR